MIEVEGDRTATPFYARPPNNVPRLMSLNEARIKSLRDAIVRYIHARDHLVRSHDIKTDPKY